MYVDKLKRLDWHDVLIRSVKTFFQAAIPVLITALRKTEITDGKEAIKAIWLSTVVSAATAGIAAVWNMIYGLKCIDKENRCAELEVSSEAEEAVSEGEPFEKEEIEE